MLGDNSTRRSFVRSIGAGGALLAATGVASAHGGPRKSRNSHNSRNFRTHLSSENVVTHDSDSKGQGQAIFQLDKDGDALSYKLNVANIENVIGAHIHHAPAGEHGPIVAYLFGSPFVNTPLKKNAVTVDGTLAQGTLTSSDLHTSTGPHGFSGGFETFLDQIRKGNMFVLVHTLQNKPGAIRGQIR